MHYGNILRVRGEKLKITTKVKDLKTGSKVTIVGAGVSGRALALLAARSGFSVFVTDRTSISQETQEEFKKMA